MTPTRHKDSPLLNATRPATVLVKQRYLETSVDEFIDIEVNNSKTLKKTQPVRPKSGIVNG
jgi:hypothetical protein